ncbi:Pimeloyl-ACP methyl ester carboxylesterase [Cyclonatronum proteinivorum]|uniref:Pimeloyl-ACP methyl ester carboxylesterase n=1 Tax=Cyclonatronum proteinivorum TaxID=1457365 RepID=A0A345UND4_9BACT|nr:alpha/beta hydrolase [Cyclonatronum proteinivorum]AXJ01986.1 Pimeloyl-ACP methyl ester carboxylesterase [Cyclonatronum proteinivorum]
MKTFFADIDGFYTEIIDYHPERSAGQLVIALHGFGGNARTFRRLKGLLPETYRLWGLSLPWHGRTETDAVREKMSLEGYARGLAALLDEQGISRIILLCHSFGSRIGALFASLYPARTQHLVLIAPGGYYPPEDYMFRFLGSFPMRRLIRNDLFLAPFVKFLIPTLPREKKAATYNALRHIGWSFPSISLKARGELHRLRAYPGKTLLIIGDRDRLMKASYAPKIARWYQACTVEIMPGIGHLPMAEKPDALCALLVRHWA